VGYSVITLLWTTVEFACETIFSERELLFAFAKCYLPSVCRP